MRYAFAVVSILACVFLGAASVDGMLKAETGRDLAFFGLLLLPALATAVVAIGLIRGRAWGAYLFSGLILLLTLPYGLLLLLISGLGGAAYLLVGLAVIFGGAGSALLGLRVARSLKREEQERRTRT